MANDNFDTSVVKQPIIRGIQAVGSVQLLYKYNSSDGYLPIPDTILFGSKNPSKGIATGTGIPVAGFRLDSEFLRANPQIASSFVIPILGGGGVALTNNNRTGTLNLVCAKVSTPVPGDQITVTTNSGDSTTQSNAAANIGAMYTPGNAAIGVLGGGKYYDMVTIAQIQQGQTGGDSVGATITLSFMFCGLLTQVTFEGCTIATVDPIGLAGNDAVNYAIAINYLNWVVNYSDTGTAYSVAVNSGSTSTGDEAETTA